MRIAHLGLGILLVIPAGVLHAQSTTDQKNPDPLAAAAKRARDDRKDGSKPARVWDNDTIPKSGQTISVVGQSSDAADGADGSGAANAVTTQGAVPPANTGAYVQGRLSNAKEKLASLRTDLDLMQRTLVLDSQTYYGKPDYSNDRAGAQKLADEQAAIASKQQAIDEQEKEIAALQGLTTGAPQTPPDNDPAKNN